MALFQASLASGAFALVPAPLAPLLPTPEARTSTPHLHGDAFELGVQGHVEEFLEGGLDPRLSVGSGSFLTRGSLAGRDWQIEVQSGRFHSWIQASTPTFGARWRQPQGPDIAMVFSRTERLRLTLEQREGSVRGTGTALVGLADRVDLSLEAFHARARGLVQAEMEEYPSIRIDWNGVRTGGEGGLDVHVGALGVLHGRLGRAEGEPGDLEARYTLRTSSRSTTWSLGWDPEVPGPWLELVAHHGEVASTATADTAGSSRAFHDLLLRSSVHRTAGGWSGRAWRSGLGWTRIVLEIPPSSYFGPFLAWNTFNPSSWAPVEQILSDQREHLHGTLEIRRLHAGAVWNAARGRGRAEFGAETSWWALDPHLVHRTTRMSFLGVGYQSRSDTLDSWRLRAWTVAPSLLLGWDGGYLGEVSGGGEATIPLAIRRLGPRLAESGETLPRESWRGLWNTRIGWRRSF